MDSSIQYILHKQAFLEVMVKIDPDFAFLTMARGTRSAHEGLGKLPSKPCVSKIHHCTCLIDTELLQKTVGMWLV